MKQKNILLVCKMFVLLHPLLRGKARLKKTKRSGSSVWLEYMPVTHGVASSSLVRTAKQKKQHSHERCFFTDYMGLLGFDSRDNGFVSMQADASEALKTGATQ